MAARISWAANQHRLRLGAQVAVERVAVIGFDPK